MTIGTRYHILDCVGNSLGTAELYDDALELARTFLYIPEGDAPEKHVVAKFDLSANYETIDSATQASWHINDASDVMLMSDKTGDNADWPSKHTGYAKLETYEPTTAEASFDCNLLEKLFNGFALLLHRLGRLKIQEPLPISMYSDYAYMELTFKPDEWDGDFSIQFGGVSYD